MQSIFLGPAKRGDILLFSAAINRAWRSSMEIGIKVVAENPITTHKCHIVSAYFTLVALDENGKPTDVAKVIAETRDEKRRFIEAEMRRAHRKKEKAEREQHRETFEKD